MNPENSIFIFILYSDLPDPGSRPVLNRSFFIWIRNRSDPSFLKRTGTGSGRILAEIWPVPDPVSLERLCFPRSASFSFYIHNINIIV